MTSFPPLPRSQDTTSKKQPKLRATCDACKDAKTRCNRQVPSCYRCQNQKLRCVYNLSRRMGRPRRLKTSVDLDETGRIQERGMETSRSSENGNMRNERNIAEAALYHNNTNTEQSEEQGNLPSTVDVYNHHSTSSRPQEVGILSSLMDSFNPPESYEISQLQPPIDLINFDGLTDFDFLNDPPLTISSGPPSPIISRSLQNTKSQSESTLEYPSTREKSVSGGTITPRHKAHSFSNPSTYTLTYGDPTSIDGINDKPIQSFESAVHLHQMQASGSEAQYSYRKTGSKPLNDEDDESGSAEINQSVCCGCYEIVLRKLSDLDESQPDIFSSTIDAALMLEKGVQMHIAQVLHCGTCATKRPTLLLLLAIVIDHVVCVLENTSSFSNKSQIDNSSFLVRSSRISFRATTAEAKGEGTAGTPMDKPPLLVGRHEISSDEKNRFLKQLLKDRLSDLSSTLRQLMQYMQRISQNSPSKHGTMMVVETYKRLQSIIGRVELWDG